MKCRRHVFHHLRWERRVRSAGRQERPYRSDKPHEMTRVHCLAPSLQVVSEWFLSPKRGETSSGLRSIAKIFRNVKLPVRHSSVTIALTYCYNRVTQPLLPGGGP